MTHANGVIASEAMEMASEASSDTARYDALVRLFRAIGHYKSIAELTSVLAAEASKLIQFDFIGISRCDPAMSTVEWHVAIPGKGIERGSIEATSGETITGWVYEKQKPLVIASLDRETRLQSNILRTVQDGIQSVCAVPLSCTQSKLGALFVGSVAADVYSEEEVRFLSLVATQVCCAIENNFAYEQIAQLKDRLEQENLYLEEEIREEHGFDQIIGRSAPLRKVLLQVETVAPTDCTVLIYGETGTGKELIARAIHDRSPRHAAPFVKLNCAAIPTGLLESELFGHEKGAFTGAISQRIGRFELANHGTMFLDEIGEVPLELQPKLLRVLQEREFERLGNSRTLRTDTRLIAATNRDLEVMMEEQHFRSDLFYRLNVFPIRIPALRERPEDIPLLVRRFAQQCSRRLNKQIDSISSDTMKALCNYHWPGNIRELQNVIERAVIVTKGPELQVPFSELKRRAVPNGDGRGNTTLEEAERAHILATLKQTDWVIAGPNGAAARLGMHRSTLQFRMKKLGISVVRVGKQ
jgi:formate hydrogenlyase transcriptional activator